MIQWTEDDITLKLPKRRLEPGDQVRVLYDLKENARYDGVNTVPEMVRLAGEIVTLDSVDYHSTTPSFRIVHTNDYTVNYTWTLPMFEGGVEHAKRYAK